MVGFPAAPHSSQSSSPVDWYTIPAITAPPGYTTNLVNPPTIAYKTTICNSICAVVIVTTVALRISSRAFIVKKLGIDDYLNLVALVFWIATTAVFQWLVSVGMGKHLWDVRMSVYSPHFLRGWAIAAVLYSACMMFIKVSILMLYNRVFPFGTFKYRWGFIMLFTIGYSIAGMLVSIFACTPVESAWNLWVKADHCISSAAFYIANGTLNCLSDLMILALPIPVVWGLALARRQRIHLCMMFSVGLVSCIISIVRLRSMSALLSHGTRDITFDIVNINIWSQIEFTAAFICSCSPALRPLLIWLFGSFFNEHKSTSSIPSGDPYALTIGRAKSPCRLHMFDLELGGVAENNNKTQTLVSANGSGREVKVARKNTDQDGGNNEGCRRIEESVDESGQGSSGIVVEKGYRVYSGRQSLRLSSILSPSDY